MKPTRHTTTGKTIALRLCHVLSAFVIAGSAQGVSAQERAQCREWHECRQLALDALGRGDFEQFHDLAWRSVQTGPPRDPDLMYLLARAQSLSGRPHDALVMLGRLAEKGRARDAIADAITNDEFRAVRALRDWPAVEARIRSAVPKATPTAPSASPAAVPEPAARAPSEIRPAAIPRAVTATPLHTSEEALRLPSPAWNPTGVAYDRVSARFVLADRKGRKLSSIDERSHHLVDLVDAESAGFYEITALEIDGRRGDLWVVSANKPDAEGQPASVLHRLQLVSGRPRAAVPLPAKFGAARFEDVGVSAGGTVFVLDGLGARIFRLSPDGHSFILAATLALDHMTSVAPVDDHVIYVAHSKGIVRIDASTGASAPLRGRKNVQLEGFERIRWKLNSLIGVQRLADGTRRVVSLRLAGRGGRLRAMSEEIVEADVTMTDPTAVALSDDVFYFVTCDSPACGPDAEIIVRRARLR